MNDITAKDFGLLEDESPKSIEFYCSLLMSKYKISFEVAKAIVESQLRAKRDKNDRT